MISACCEDIFFTSGDHTVQGSQPRTDEVVIESSITLPRAALVESVDSLSDDEHDNEDAEKIKQFSDNRALERHWTVGASDATARSARKLQGPMVASVVAFGVLALRFSMHWNSK